MKIISVHNIRLNFFKLIFSRLQSISRAFVFDDKSSQFLEYIISRITVRYNTDTMLLRQYNFNRQKYYSNSSTGIYYRFTGIQKYL